MSSLINGRSEAAHLLSAFIDAAEAAARHLGIGATHTVLTEGADGELTAWRVVRGKTEKVGRADELADAVRRRLAAGHVELRIDPEKLIEADLKLPAGARGFVSQVIEHRLEKLTPWQPEKVVFGYEILPGSADGQDDVRLLATSRQIAEAALASARAFGFEAATLGSAAEPIGQRLRVDLLAGSGDVTRKRRRRRIGGAAVAVLVGSTAVFAASQWQASMTSAERNRLDNEIASVRRQLIPDDANDQRKSDLVLIQSKTPERAVFMLIDRLARTLPDDTVLDELEIKPDMVRIAGSSADASVLVGLIEADGGLRDAEFGAPVTRQLDRRDHFEIVASRRSGPTANGS